MPMIISRPISSPRFAELHASSISGVACLLLRPPPVATLKKVIIAKAPITSPVRKSTRMLDDVQILKINADAIGLLIKKCRLIMVGSFVQCSCCSRLESSDASNCAFKVNKNCTRRCDCRSAAHIPATADLLHIFPNRCCLLGYRPH